MKVTLLSLLLIFSCLYSDLNAQVKESNLFLDTNKAVIIPLSLNNYRIARFDSTFKASKLNDVEFDILVNLFCDALLKNKNIIDTTFRTYKYQLVAAINENGEKIVWINAFCNDFDDWKRYLIFVFDGGLCYFQMTINLTKNYWYGFNVNSSG